MMTNPRPAALVPFLEVCKILGVHYNTGYQLRAEGSFPIPVERIGGRYFCRRIDVEAYTGQAIADAPEAS